MDFAVVILIIAVIFLITGSVVLIWMNVRLTENRIDPSQCPQTEGNFGVYGGKSYQSSGSLASINTCGANGTDVCQSQANSIKDAITYCNTNINICDAFVYSVPNKQVTIVDKKATLSTDNNYDLFTRQYPSSS
jgi:hypothetical protein